MTQKSLLPEVTLGFLRGTVGLLERLRKQQSVETIAGEINLSVSAVFKRLKILKAHFGKDFIEPDPNRLGFLSPQAEAFVANAERILNDVDALFSPAKFGIRKATVATYPSVKSLFVPQRLLPALLHGGAGTLPFQEAFPYHELEFRQVASAEDGAREVEQGVADCAIIDREAGNPADATHSFTRLDLFPCVERGFIYRNDSEFAELARKPGDFRLSSLARFNVVLTQSDLWAVKKGYLPDPEAGRATRTYFGTYAEVLNAVAAGFGVGIGFRPKRADAYPDVGFLGFGKILDDSQRANRAVQYLQKRSHYTFDLYVKDGWDAPAVEGGLPEASRAVVQAILKAKDGYTHDYVT